MMNTFKNLRDLVGVISAYCRLEAAIVDELERQHEDIYALKEVTKMLRASSGNFMIRLGKLERATFGREDATAQTVRTQVSDV